MKVLLALFGVLLPVAFLEALALLKVVDYRSVLKTHTDLPWSNPINRLDPELVHLRKPFLHLTGKVVGGDITNYRSTTGRNEYSFNVRYDSEGFRNPDENEGAVIVVAGDSFVEAVYTPEEKLFTSVLENSLRVPVRNLGQSWFGPQQGITTLFRFGLPRRPKYAVWVFFEGNDLYDYNRFESLSRTWPQEMIALSSFAERSLIRNMSRSVKKFFRRKQILPAAPKGLCPSGKEFFFYYPVKPLSDDDERALRGTFDLLNKSTSDLASQHIKFIVAFMPDKFRVYRDLCTISPETTLQEWSGNNLPVRFRDALEGSAPQVTFVDFTEPLRAAAKSGRDTYLQDDTHLSDEGHQIVAETLEKKIHELESIH